MSARPALAGRADICSIRSQPWKGFLASDQGFQSRARLVRPANSLRHLRPAPLVAAADVGELPPGDGVDPGEGDRHPAPVAAVVRLPDRQVDVGELPEALAARPRDVA